MMERHAPYLFSSQAAWRTLNKAGRGKLPKFESAEEVLKSLRAE
jgi:hypothetical protein